MVHMLAPRIVSKPLQGSCLEPSATSGIRIETPGGNHQSIWSLFLIKTLPKIHLMGLGFVWELIHSKTYIILSLSAGSDNIVIIIYNASIFISLYKYSLHWFHWRLYLMIHKLARHFVFIPSLYLIQLCVIMAQCIPGQPASKTNNKNKIDYSRPK